MGTCRLTGEFIGGRLWRLGVVAVTIYELLFAHTRSTGVGQQLVVGKWDFSEDAWARVFHGLICTYGHRMAVARQSVV